MSQAQGNRFHRNGKPMFVRSRALPALLGSMLFLAALPGSAQLSGDATFFPVPPCTVVDTRQAGGSFGTNEVRDYRIAGNSLSGQGGSADCKITAYSNGQTPVQAVELLITGIASSTTGTGYIAASAGDVTPGLGAMVTVTPGALNTNTGPVALAQTGGNPPASQFRIKFVGGINATVNVLVRVVGYYAKPVQTVWVHPVPGDPVASGTALINALAGIHGGTMQHYVLKLEPGIYDIGTTTLNMKPWVDIEGSGELATVIQGESVPVISGAPSAELRELAVTCAGSTRASVGIKLVNADTRIRQVTITATGPAAGIEIIEGNPEIIATTIRIDGGGDDAGIIVGGSTPIIRDVRIFVNDPASAGVGIECDPTGAPQVENVHVEVRNAPQGAGFSCQVGSISSSSFLVTGGAIATGIIAHSGFLGLPIRISHSTVGASGSSSSYGIDGISAQVDSSDIEGTTSSVVGSVSVGGSKLSGGPAARTVTCAGVWNASYAFFSGPACP